MSTIDDHSRLLRETLATGLDGAVLCAADEPFGVSYVSDAARSTLLLLGVSPSAFVRLDEQAAGGGGSTDEPPVAISDVLPAGLDADELAIAREAAQDGSRVVDTIDVRGPEGTIRGHMAIAVRRIKGHLVWSIRAMDLSERQTGRPRPEPTLDPLTGLTTRPGIRRALEFCLERLDVLGEAFALELVDVDNLTGINDRFGHDVGDSVLREVGERLRALVRGSDAVGRVGDDEFVLVWPGVRSLGDVRLLHNRVSESIAAEFDVGGRVVNVTVSAGALFVGVPQDCDPDDLLRGVDSSMRRARADGPGRMVLTEQRDHVDRTGTFVTVGELREALRENELVLYTQPMVDVFTGRTAGAEMLVRWQHPERGLLGPADFLVAAEATDVMDEIGAWVIDKSVALTAAWERTSPLGDFRIGINAWPRQLTHSDLVGQLAAALDRHGSRPERFVVEVIESQELQSRTKVAEQLRRLLELGVGVGIDDFGSGFANMSYLRDLPIDMIKVDRALVGRYPTRREEAILEAIQSIGSAIDAEVVLEGVEQIAQLETARRCGVRLVQGYLVGRPAPASRRPPEGRFPLPPMTAPAQRPPVE
ncbi:MAG: bifunctional diguanylate cyclase/phosphodiesterase [Actinobacteria bacterium]|nr:bifunctional diguanylate cyclase/phosphodiesterase [Actinomycetota bacterium]